ncbi:hypothetical protein H1R20_g2870, partial [Candolleomyces eurysporus]
MPPKKTTPPLDADAVLLDFASQEPLVVKVINAEAKKLVQLRKDAGAEFQADGAVSKSTVFLMKAALRAIVLLFDDWEPKAVEILRTDPTFVSFVRQASAVIFTHQTWCSDHNISFPSEVVKSVLALATDLKNESKARRGLNNGLPYLPPRDLLKSDILPSRTLAFSVSGTVIEFSDTPDSDSSSGGAPSTTDNSVVDVDVTMSEPTPSKGRGKGKASMRALAPPAVPTTRKMDYISVPGMDTGSPAYLRSMALNSKRARAERDLPPIDTGSTISRTAHRLFPDGGLLEYIDDRAISNEFISLVLAKTHGAIANFTEHAQEEDSLRRAISETCLEMVSVIHKLHIFANYWEILNKEYAALKSSLATFCSEKAPEVPEAPEIIPLDPAIEI